MKDLECVKRALTRIIELTEFFLFYILLFVLLVTLFFAPTRGTVFAQSSPEEATTTTLALGFIVFFWLKDFFSKSQHLNRIPRSDFLNDIEMKIKPLLEIYLDTFTMFTRLLGKLYEKVRLRIKKY